MGSRPWGPHGPEVSPNQVKPNPTAAGNFPPLGGGAPYGLPTAAAPAPTGSGGPHVSIILSLIMIPFVWMFWICLYPLTAAIGFFVGALSTPVAFRLLSLQKDEANVALGIGIIVGFAAVVVMSRVEYRMAQNSGYRIVRHVVRLFLFGVLALPWIQAMVFDVAGGSEMRYILGMLSNPRYLMMQLTRPQNSAIVVGVMVGMHFLLWQAERLRAFWHRRLMWIGLK